MFTAQFSGMLPFSKYSGYSVWGSNVCESLERTAGLTLWWDPCSYWSTEKDPNSIHRFTTCRLFYITALITLLFFLPLQACATHLCSSHCIPCLVSPVSFQLGPTGGRLQAVLFWESLQKLVVPHCGQFALPTFNCHCFTSIAVKSPYSQFHYVSTSCNIHPNTNWASTSLFNVLFQRKAPGGGVLKRFTLPSCG